MIQFNLSHVLARNQELMSLATDLGFSIRDGSIFYSCSYILIENKDIALSLEKIRRLLRILQFHFLSSYLAHHPEQIGMTVGPRQIILAQPVAIKRHVGS